MPSMPPASKVVTDPIGSAGRAARFVEQGASSLLGVRVARALYGRWRRMSGPEREPLSPLAEDVRERALDLRGASDPESAGRELEKAEERLGAGLGGAAEAGPAG